MHITVRNDEIALATIVMSLITEYPYPKGVPRILESGPAFLQADIKDAQLPDWHMYGEYISNARINLNIRQVNMIAPAT